MTIADYYSIPARFGILLLMLSCSALINQMIHLEGVMNASLFKCVFAVWALLGLISVDIVKNAIRQWRRQAHPPLIGASFIRFKKQVFKNH